MLFAELVGVSGEVAATSSRSVKVRKVADLLSRCGHGELEPAVGFLSGVPRQGKVGVGYAAVYGSEAAAAEEPSLLITDVDVAITRLSGISGPGSQRARANALEGLLSRATLDEQGFIRRLLTGELRQGALEGVMIEAIARSSGLRTDLVRRAVMLRGDLHVVASAAAFGGEEAVSSIGLVVLQPFRPMLAKTGSDVGSALAETGPASVEWKLDGARIQVHHTDGEARVFTRNLNDVTDRLPAVIEAVRSLGASPFVLDGEAVATDDSGEALPFQETMSRFGADAPTGAVPIVPFFFDILHYDGRDLIDVPLEERLDVLDALVPPRFQVPRVLTTDEAIATDFLAQARRLRHEGVMVKALDSRYEAGNRGSAWIKVKPAHTLDLAILAAEWGHGRRAGWLSNLHLGARDPGSGEMVMLGKTFKGLTDEMLAWQTERLLELEMRRTRNVVYVRPELVAEIAFDGVLPSPRYPGGMALRFARVKGYRPDKGVEDTDTIDTVRAIFEGRL